MRISDLSSDVCSSDLSVRIQPVHIDYGPATAEISWHSDESAGANVKRLLERKGRLDLRLRFLEPFDPAICPDRKALAAMSRERIAASIAAHLPRSEEHTSELQSLMRISYAVFCLKKKTKKRKTHKHKK